MNGAVITGSNNTVMGYSCLEDITSGGNNTIFGAGCGTAYTSSESNNIILGYNIHGTVSESNVIRIGNSSNTSCYITGINGVTVTGTAVLCSTTGQLGTIASSERYKENIQPLSDETSSVLELNPVKFNYKADSDKSIRYGLIAEEVEKVFPYLVFYKDDIPESVNYHELPVLLLKEIQKLNKRIQALEERS